MPSPKDNLSTHKCDAPKCRAQSDVILDMRGKGLHLCKSCALFVSEIIVEMGELPVWKREETNK